MPEFARVLRFPSRRAVGSLPAEEAAVIARQYLDSPFETRQDDFDKVSGQPDVLLHLVTLLKDLNDTNPLRAIEEAEALHRLVGQAERRCGVFDEHDYLLG